MKEKVALVTGASSGIGRAIALAFATKGAKVMVADLNEEGGHETVMMIKDAGGEAAFVKADVSKEADVKAMVDETVKTLGGLDYAANNAGIESAPTVLHLTTAKDWQMIIDVNLTGVFFCLKHEIAYMLENNGGAIVNTSSVAGLRGLANMSPYVASKHGVTGLTRAAALEYAKQGIRVNSIHPGGIKTPLVARLEAEMPEMFAGMVAGHPIGRMGEPNEIGEAVVWLCSDEASFVTGHQMAVDGGFMAG
ncbi:MAG: SDR family oxidoreductase [Anaerolineales bacterium]|nr:SDR family oxidoreductase [Anaerolineales bacterium]